jgi:3-hydroxyisobutyrate dehydrogenase-like beta-hydroxyacid dehydrogenase
VTGTVDGDTGRVVAFLGLGRMGAPMATNLAAAGYALVVHNRTRGKAEQLADRVGAEVAATPRDAASRADVIITMLADEAAFRGVCDGPDGLFAGLRHGATLVDMGTTGPVAIAELAPRVASAGGVHVDAPVSGSTAAAASADLTIMVGASTEVFARVEALLGAMGGSVHHVGDTGAGAVTKLAVNNVIYALGNAIAESLVLAERVGIGRQQLYDVLEDSAVAAPMVGYRREAFLDPEGTPPAFAMTLAAKDLRLISELASSVGLPVEQAEANLSLFERAIAAGLGDHDMADVAVHLRGQQAGREVSQGSS